MSRRYWRYIGTFIIMELNLWAYSCWLKTILWPVCLKLRTFLENQGGEESLLWCELVSS